MLDGGVNANTEARASSAHRSPGDGPNSRIPGAGGSVDVGRHRASRGPVEAGGNSRGHQAPCPPQPVAGILSPGHPGFQCRFREVAGPDRNGRSSPGQSPSRPDVLEPAQFGEFRGRGNHLGHRHPGRDRPFSGSQRRYRGNRRPDGAEGGGQGIDGAGLSPPARPRPPGPGRPAAAPRERPP